MKNSNNSIRQACKYSVLLIILFLVNTGFVLSQNNGDKIKLDLETAIDMAFNQNPQIRIAMLSIESANAQYYETIGNFLPNISASGLYNRNIKRPVIFMPDDPPFFGQVLEIGSEHSYNAGFSASMPIYNQSLLSSIKANRIQKELSEEELRASKIELRYNVKMAYYNTLLAKESLEIMNQRFENAKDNLANIRSMYNQEMVAEFDLIRAEVQTENLHPTLLQSENVYKLSLNYLKVLVGIDKSHDVELEGNLVDIAEKILIEFNIQQAERSITQNTNLLQLNLQGNLLSQQAKAIRASNLPSIVAIGNYQFQTQANDLKFSDYDWVQTAMAGFQINIPIFNGFTTRNRAKQLIIASEQLMLQKEYLEDNLNVQVEDIIRTMSLAVDKAANAEKNVNLAQRAYNIALARYDSGQGTLLEVNDSEIALSQARFNFIQALHEILQAKTEHEKFIGIK